LVKHQKTIFFAIYCKFIKTNFLSIIEITKFELDKNLKKKNSNPSYLNFLFKLIFHNFDTPFVSL